MEQLIDLLVNIDVFLYVGLVVAIQFAYTKSVRTKKERIENNRKAQELPKGSLVNQTRKLEELKAEAKQQVTWLLLPIVALPFILVVLKYLIGLTPAIGWINQITNPFTGVINSSGGLLLTFLLFALWLLFTTTDLAKAAVGGIAFRTVMVFSNTIQVGDRVTIAGSSGKITDIGIFYLTLVTIDDDKVCLPTNSLWGATLINANDGDRSSLTVTNFYLSPMVNAKQLQAAEDAIWEAIQASPYFEPSKVKQIFYHQQPEYIQLTAKAYVASTYNEPLFKSDITRRFLQFAKNEGILLADQKQPLASPPGVKDKIRQHKEKNHG